MAKYELVYELVKKMYCLVLKDELEKLVKKSDSKVDDMVVGVLDRVFMCEEGK